MVHLPVTRRILRKARYGFGNIHCCRFTTNAWDIVSRCDGALWSSSTVVLLFTAGLSVEGGSRCAARQGPTGLILIGAGGSHSSTEVRPTCSNYAMGCCLVLMSCQMAIWEGRIFFCYWGVQPYDLQSPAKPVRRCLLYLGPAKFISD